MKNILLIIDPQNDFVDKAGSLSVPGAGDDMSRLAGFINQKADDISAIVITLDSHAPLHIATPVYWRDAGGNPPEPFSLITYEDVASGKWQARFHSALALEYLKQLESKGRKLIIWPPHTLFGTEGWAIYPPLYSALFNWADKTGGSLIYHTKGQDERTEMFSAVRPDVSFDYEADELSARKFMSYFAGDYANIYIAGEAEDYCVKETVTDMLAMGSSLGKSMVMLKDCMSCINPEDPSLTQFKNMCEAKGVRFAASTEL